MRFATRARTMTTFHAKQDSHCLSTYCTLRIRHKNRNVLYLYNFMERVASSQRLWQVDILEVALLHLHQHVVELRGPPTFHKILIATRTVRVRTVRGHAWPWCTLRKPLFTKAPLSPRSRAQTEHLGCSLDNTHNTRQAQLTVAAQFVWVDRGATSHDFTRQ